VTIFGDDKHSKKIYPPGQHGMAKKEVKNLNMVQLMEKQKAKYSYGILETIQRFIQKKHQLLKVLLVKFFYNYVKQD
jgi:ribosomal protein S4